MTAYYNEFDPGAAAWLRELIKRGLIADGEVDDRSIIDVRPAELSGFTQCHFFAGIGGWSLALRLAGWPDDRPVWTGSPPCQPFSNAGARRGREDERHLAPYFLELVRSCRPGVLFGEQVASAAVFGKATKSTRKRTQEPPDWAWLDDISNRLEAARYAVGAVDFPSAGVGAPHIRQRTYFCAVDLGGMANGGIPGLEGHGGNGDRGDEPGRVEADPAGPVAEGSGASGLADAAHVSINGGGDARESGRPECEDAGKTDGLAGPWRSFADWFGICWNDCDGPCTCGDRDDAPDGYLWHEDEGWIDILDLLRVIANCPADMDPVRPGTDHGGWASPDWLFCRDGKWRPVEPGTQPLAHGVSARVGRLRGYGNAINPQQASAFIESVMDVLR